MNGLNLLNAPQFVNHWKLLIVTSTERTGFSWYCSAGNFDIKKFNSPLFVIESRKRGIRRFFYADYYRMMLRHISGKINNSYESVLSGRFKAPSQRLIEYQHKFNDSNLSNDLNCLSKISQNMQSLNMPVVFMLFPAAQTSYPNEAPLKVDDFTKKYIPHLVEQAKILHIHMLDSENCLAQTPLNVQDMQDTHMNAKGYDLLASCMGKYLKRYDYWGSK